MTPQPDLHRRRTATGTAVLIGAVAHVCALFNWSTDLERTANPLGYGSRFFDIQARAFLDGHLWVPDGILGIEAFRHDGHEYMYFGPFPALLRIPLLWTTPEFDGRLTVLSMLLAFVVFTVMTTRLLWLVRDLVRPGEPVTRREAAVLGVVLVLCLAGTSLTFNASLPWVYHEVYAWAVALAVGCAYWLVRVQAGPTRRTVGWLAAFALALVLTRTPGGLAACVGTAAVGVWLLAGRRGTGRMRWVGGGIVLLALAILGVGVAFNMAKFGHPYLFPLQDQVWTELNEHRREALRVNGGTITGPQFFTTGLNTYFRPDGVRFVDYFPWVTFPAEPARGVGDAFVDQSYRTGSVTAFMPLLLVMALVSVPLLFRPRVPVAVRMLRIPVLSMVLITGAVMNYGYYAYRYTCDFVPALVIGTLVTGVYLARLLQRMRPWVATSALGVLATGTLYSVTAHLLVAFQVAAFTSAGPVLTDYLATQESFSPGAQARLTTVGDAPPAARGNPDQIHITGDCEAMYVETGEDADAWQLAERRSVVVVAELEEKVRATSSVIVTIDTEPQRWVRLQVNARRQARLLIQGDEAPTAGPWFDVPPPYTIRIGVRDIPGMGVAEVASTPGGTAGYVRSFSWGDDWVREPISIDATLADRDALAERGVHLRAESGITPPTCARILQDTLAHGVE